MVLLVYIYYLYSFLLLFLVYFLTSCFFWVYFFFLISVKRWGIKVTVLCNRLSIVVSREVIYRWSKILNCMDKKFINDCSKRNLKAFIEMYDVLLTQNLFIILVLAVSNLVLCFLSEVKLYLFGCDVLPLSKIFLFGILVFLLYWRNKLFEKKGDFEFQLLDIFKEECCTASDEEMGCESFTLIDSAVSTRAQRAMEKFLASKN